MDPQNPTFLEKMKMSPSQLWDKHKWFLIIFGLLMLAIKFQDVIFDLLVKNSRKTMDEAVKKSNTLQNEQNQANSQANQLVKEAQQLGENKTKVDEDWHKK